MRHHTLLPVLILCCVVGACGPSEPPIQNDTILLGHINAIDGMDRPLLHQAAALAMQDINDRGGLLIAGQRYSVELRSIDVDDPAAAVDAMRRLINHDKVLALIGPSLTPFALPAADVAESSKVPMVSPASTHPETTAHRRFVFRMTYTDNMQALALARFARLRLDKQRLAVLFDVANAYSRTLVEEFSHHFERLGGEIVAHEEYATGQEDFSQALERIYQTSPDVLFLPTTDEGVRSQAETIESMNWQITILGTDAWTPEQLAYLPALNDAYVSHLWHPDMNPNDDRSRRFAQRFEGTYGHPPYAMSVLTYDAFSLLFDALERASEATPEGVRQALADTQSFPALSGSIQFGEHSGDPQKPIVLLRLQDGRVTFQELLEDH